MQPYRFRQHPPFDVAAAAHQFVGHVGMADHLDILMESTTNDELYSLLQSMRSEVVNAIPGDTENLARITTLTLPASAPSMVLAYDLYGNLDDEQDLIDRNGVRHPGFIQGGRPIEVLDNG